jgi:signal transduction histidine kinase
MPRSVGQTENLCLGTRFEGFDVRYLSDLSLNGFQEAVGNLPTGTVVLMLSIFEDADGKKFVPRNATAAIAPRSTAPIFSVYDSYVGTGVVGGWMDTFQGVGRQLALLIERKLAGEKGLPQISFSEALPVVDWRAITRFGIDPNLLPPETDIRFRKRSLWEDYRLEILATTTVILLQAGMIAVLIVQDRRRRRAEAELARQRLELAHLSRASLLGELSGAFAHELNQPLTAILANAQAAGRLLERNEIDADELKEILGEIVVDDKRAAGVITELRRLLIKGETTLEPIDLTRVVGETLALARSELVVRQTRIANRTGYSEMPVRGNFAQLQQIVLNLIMNAADATSARPSSERLIEIDVQRRDTEHCELSVSDNGPGLTDETRNAAFKPFASTKPNGLGLGLAICRSIATAHGGTLQFDQTYRQGARVVLTLPLDGQRS